MAAANRIVGQNVYCTFKGTAITGDHTSIKFSEEQDLADVTAGVDTGHYYVPLTMKDGTLDFETFYDGSTETVWDNIAPGNVGTLVVAPRGTTSTYPQYTWTRAIVKSRNLDMPFADGVKVTATFQFSAAGSEGAYS